MSPVAGETSPRPPDEGWVRRLFFGLALLYVLPFWTVHYLPTVDGPCHTYNAWIIRQYGNSERYPLFQRYYEINAQPYPNWISQGTMALLMLAVPPLVAEKLFVSLYALVFLGGAWYLAGAVKPGDRWLAFLAFPFVHNHTFQFGFYNFSMGLALFPWILGFWWRRRDRVDLGYVVGMNLLLWLCYFSHSLAFALSLLGVAVLWLGTLPLNGRDNWRRHLLHIPALAPQVVLPLWYLAVEGGGPEPSPWTLIELLRYLLELQVLFVFDGVQRWLGVALAGAFFVLVLLTLRRRRLLPREGDAFLLLALVLTLFYFLSPEGLMGGTMLKNRLSLYPWLALIPWLSPGLGTRARRVAVAALALVLLLNAGYLVRWYRTLSGEMDRYLAALEPVRPDTRLLPLRFRHNTPAAKVNVLGHAVSYVALEKGLVDWDNYEATSSHFPTRFRDSAPPPNTGELESRPGFVRTRLWKNRADYVYTWQMPPDHPLGSRLERFYDPVLTENGGVLWERRRGEARTAR
ncbi:MAG TPA: hypothetical protein VHC97_26200 [Thermoanaerobaculia bacterium]|jgi:hypothetical protein|nr:hypothetical protein [Thermoanaerobaculia bacterium]